MSGRQGLVLEDGLYIGYVELGGKEELGELSQFRSKKKKKRKKKGTLRRFV